MDNKKTYLFASYTKFASRKLTGAHRRFLELIKSVAQDAQVLFVGYDVPQLKDVENVTFFTVSEKERKGLPKHLAGAADVLEGLKKYRRELSCDYAVSFSPVISMCYWMTGIKHIVSLFREDLIGYQRALQVSGLKLGYFQLQERLAVKASEKIIVQCENDRKNLIQRNQQFCPGLAEKVHIQINNANASWMNCESVSREQENDVPRILFIGNFSDRRKGHFLLLPAAARLLDEGFQFELLLAGDGAELENCRQRYSGYPGIHFLGRVQNMGQYLKQSDFEMVPSLIDSCPNTVLEGLNAGIAVYGTNTGGIPDLLGDSAYLFEADEESIYLFMKNALENKRYINDAESQRKRKAELTFDWGKAIQRIIEE